MFAIPAGPLGSALTEWAEVSGVRMLASSEALRGARTSGALGAMPPREALRRLLDGTGLSARVLDEHAVTLVQLRRAASTEEAADGATPLNEINVQGEGEGETATGPVKGFVAHRSGTASKTDASILETPQSVSVVTRGQIERQGATTVSEALRYTAGVVSGTAGLQSRRFDPVFLRGFGGFAADATYAAHQDGLRWLFPGRTAVQIDPFLLERVEVFKGPSSVLYGRATPGGFVNLVTKRPTDAPVNEVFARYGNHNYREAGLDVGGPIDAEGKFLYRMIALGRDAETQVRFQKDQRILLAPSLTWKPTDNTTLTVQAMYQRDPETSETAFLPPRGTLLPNPYGKLKNNFFQGDPHWNEFSRTVTSLSTQFEHKFSDAVTFRQNARFGRIEDTFKSVDDNGLDADNIHLNRYSTIAKHDIKNFGVDNQLETKFSTGALDHTVLFGVDHLRLDGPWTYGFTNVAPLNIFNPDYNGVAKPVPLVRFDERVSQTGVYAQDQIALDKWRFWFSGRHDWSDISQRRDSFSTGAELAYARAKDSAFTGRAGVVYLFDNGLAPYASYSTSFEPSLENVSGSSKFDPTTGKQWEIGVKYEPPGYNAFVTLSLFDITKKNVATASPTVNPATGLYDVSVNGEVRSRGVELEGKASLAEGFDLIAALAYTDAKVTKSTEGTEMLDGGIVSHQGRRPVAVPKYTASLWANYTFQTEPLSGLSFGAGVRYIGSTFATQSNLWNQPGYVRTSAKVPSFTLVDALVSYDFGKRIARAEGLNLTINAKNLFNKEYIAACNGFGSCLFGEGRTVLATLRYRW